MAESAHKSFSAHEAKRHRQRSALERYDHEFSFRQKVATLAAQQKSDATSTPETSLRDLSVTLDIAPYEVDECDNCQYMALCRSLMGNHASQRITQGRLGVRTWRALEKSGVRSVRELAELDVSAFTATASEEGWNVDSNDNEKKLNDAKRRAQLIRSDQAWAVEDERGVVFPRAQVEVDVDFEYDTDSQACYLITARVTTPDGAREVAVFEDFDATTFEEGAVLIREYLDWLLPLLRRAEVQWPEDSRPEGQAAALIYHWSGPENWMVRKAMGEDSVDYREYATRLRNMEEAVGTKTLFSVHGTSVKVIGKGCGFGYRADDAGGAHSLVKLDEARSDDPIKAQEARRWLADYNEDDVDVMHHIRETFLANPYHSPAYALVASPVGERPAEV